MPSRTRSPWESYSLNARTTSARVPWSHATECVMSSSKGSVAVPDDAGLPSRMMVCAEPRDELCTGRPQRAGGGVASSL